MPLLFPTGIVIVLLPGDNHTEASLSTMQPKDQAILFYASLVTPNCVMLIFVPLLSFDLSLLFQKKQTTFLPHLLDLKCSNASFN